MPSELTPDAVRALAETLRDMRSPLATQAADALTALQRRVADAEEVLDDKRRLTRELNAALDGTAGSESLCDAVAVAQNLRARMEAAEAKLREIGEIAAEQCSSDVSPLAELQWLRHQLLRVSMLANLTLAKDAANG